jgi:type II secretory ATPase GspE/PulE/Tfp pilus assembly ATPase PilB-like protein
MIEELLKEAVLLNASDVHFVPEGDSVHVRFRIEGGIRKMIHLDKDKYDKFLRKIKIDTGLRIDDHDKPKDGSLELEIDQEPIL